MTAPGLPAHRRPPVVLLATVILTALGPGWLTAQMSASGASRLADLTMPVACPDSLLPAANVSLDHGYRSAVPRAMVMPPLDPAPPSRGRLSVDFYISARGTVDSLRIRGDADPGYRQALRARMLEHTFWPAVYRDCAVPAQVAIEFTFP